METLFERLFKSGRSKLETNSLDATDRSIVELPSSLSGPMALLLVRSLCDVVDAQLARADLELSAWQQRYAELASALSEETRQHDLAMANLNANLTREASERDSAEDSLVAAIQAQKQRIDDLSAALSRETGFREAAGDQNQKEHSKLRDRVYDLERSCSRLDRGFSP